MFIADRIPRRYCGSQVALRSPLSLWTPGLTASLQGPPDSNYDHANFYWRLELQPPEQVNIDSPTTIGNSTLNMVVNLYNGATVRITAGTGAGQERTIASNTATTLTVTTTMERPAGYHELLSDSRIDLAVWSFEQCVAGFLCRAQSRRSHD